MELIGSFFLVLALAVIVALFITRPFLSNTNHKTAGGALLAEQEQDHLASSLLAERDRVLNSLQELDFDYTLGKIPQEDYPQQREVLLRTGADVLRRLDSLSVEQSADTAQEAVEDRIEAAVAARRADAAQRNTSPVEQPVLQAAGANGKGKDELEELIALRKRERKESAAGFCPRCGKPVQKSDKFCSKCGTTL